MNPLASALRNLELSIAAGSSSIVQSELKADFDAAWTGHVQGLRERENKRGAA